jgi:hypothetical protein
LNKVLKTTFCKRNIFFKLELGVQFWEEKENVPMNHTVQVIELSGSLLLYILVQQKMQYAYGIPYLKGIERKWWIWKERTRERVSERERERERERETVTWLDTIIVYNTDCISDILDEKNEAEKERRQEEESFVSRTRKFPLWIFVKMPEDKKLLFHERDF